MRGTHSVLSEQTLLMNLTSKQNLSEILSAHFEHQKAYHYVSRNRTSNLVTQLRMRCDQSFLMTQLHPTLRAMMGVLGHIMILLERQVVVS